MAVVSKAYKLTDEEFAAIVANHKTMRQIALAIGYNGQGRYVYDVIRKRIAELGLSTEHFEKAGNQYQVKYELSEILVENSPYRDSTKLKRRLCSAKLLVYKCAICGNEGQWMDKPLTLQLDHINGNHLDNRLENLRLLCPNCHTQTDTFSTRQSRAKTNENQ